MAVYTHVSDAEAATFLTRYNIGECVSLKAIASGVENSNYFLNTEHATTILTLYESRVNASDLPFFLNLMSHLASKSIACPTPVKDAKGESLQTLNGKKAALTSFLHGKSTRRIKATHTAELGTHMAAMHVASESFEQGRTNSMGIGTWRALATSMQDDIHRYDAALETHIFKGLDRLEKAWPTDLPQGIIHADLFPDNVFFIDEKLSGIIDFYFACTDFYALDLAICINAWCFERDVEFNITKARKMLRHYHAVKPLSDAEKVALPILCEGAAMRFLLSRLYDWLNPKENALVTPHNPKEYLKKWRFHQQVKSIAEYGLR